MAKKNATKNYKIIIRNVSISWTTKGTYKNLGAMLGKLRPDEELFQVEAALDNMHLIIKKYKRKVAQFVYKVYDEHIAFTIDGTYKNLEKILNKIPQEEEFFQITATPTHLHVITRKPKK